MEQISPLQIKRLSASQLFIKWSDGSEATLGSERLRRACPCASCAEARGDINHSQPLSAPVKKSMLSIVEHTAEEELSLERIWGVGNYAIGMKWADGHDTGIYTYGLLHSLAQQK